MLVCVQVTPRHDVEPPMAPLQGGGTRRLLDSYSGTAATKPASVTVVSTARQLQAAMMAGAQDILINEHLDLTELSLAFNSNTSRSPTALGDAKPSTRTIRVGFFY